MVRPENVVIHHAPGAAPNVLEATVERATFLGEFLDTTLTVGDVPIQTRVHPSLELKRGSTVWVELSPRNLMALADSNTSVALEAGAN
jgi:hypothetical protein